VLEQEITDDTEITKQENLRALRGLRVEKL